MPMWETRSVDLTVRLPREIALQVEEIQRSDPEFLSRVIQYGLTRETVFRHLRDHTASGGGFQASSTPVV
jgi:hypothetical protein